MVVAQLCCTLQNNAFYSHNSPCIFDLLGWWLTSDVTIDDWDTGYQYTTCSATFKAVYSSSSTAAFVGFSAIGLVALVGALYQRKRRVGRINLSKEEELLQYGQSTSGFEMTVSCRLAHGYTFIY